MAPTLLKIEADIATTQKQLDTLKTSSASNLESAKHRLSEKQAAKVKAAKSQEAAEKSASATSSLVSNAESDCNAVVKDSEKRCGKLEAKVAVEQSRKDSAEAELEGLAENFEVKKAALLAEASALAEQREKLVAEFGLELENFERGVAETVGRLTTQVELLTDEHMQLSTQYCSTCECLEATESELASIKEQVSAKQGDINTRKADFAKKVKRATDDRDFLAKELDRVQAESDRKLEQLNGLALEDLLAKLKEDVASYEKDTSKLQKACSSTEADLKAIADSCEKAQAGCEEAEAEASSIKDKIDSECREYREQARKLEEEIASLTRQFKELEELEWELNHKYSQQIEQEVEKSKNASSPNTKKSKKKGKKDEVSEENLQQLEEAKKLAEISLSLDKEKKEAAKLDARIAFLEKELKTTKANKKKAEKQGTEKKSKSSKQSAFDEDDDLSPRSGGLMKAAVHQDGFSNFVAVFFSMIAAVPLVGKHLVPVTTATQKTAFKMVCASLVVAFLASMNASR